MEAVGAFLVGLDPEKMSIIQEAVKRGLGEGDLKKVEVQGTSIDDAKERFTQL